MIEFSDEKTDFIKTNLHEIEGQCKILYQTLEQSKRVQRPVCQVDQEMMMYILIGIIKQIKEIESCIK